jgi:hypothetical protein
VSRQRRSTRTEYSSGTGYRSSATKLGVTTRRQPVSDPALFGYRSHRADGPTWQFLHARRRDPAVIFFKIDTVLLNRL